MPTESIGSTLDGSNESLPLLIFSTGENTVYKPICFASFQQRHSRALNHLQVLTLSLLMSFAAPLALAAQDRSGVTWQSSQGGVTLNFERANIKSVIAMFSERTCQTRPHHCDERGDTGARDMISLPVGAPPRTTELY